MSHHFIGVSFMVMIRHYLSKKVQKNSHFERISISLLFNFNEGTSKICNLLIEKGANTKETFHGELRGEIYNAVTPIHIAAVNGN